MWHTPYGERVLEGTESVLFRQTLAELLDTICAAAEFDHTPLEFGIPIFDRLQWQQQMAMLLQVAGPLLDADMPEPPASALRDSTVGAVYAQLLRAIEIEIDFERTAIPDEFEDDHTARRREVTQALAELSPEEFWPDVECVVMDEWELAVGALQNRVLHDEDWKFAEITLDLNPDRADELRQTLGIDRDYACAIPPDPDERPPATVWADLYELLNGVRPDESVFRA